MKQTALRLRLPAALLAGGLLLGSVLAAWALTLHARHAERLAAASIREASAARAAAEAPKRLQVARETAGIHAQLRDGGFLGPEQRAGWITALGRIQAGLNLRTLSWRLGPRTPSDLAPGLWLSGMTIAASPVDAARLEALLGQLRQAAPGRFTVESCALGLDPGGGAGQAECRLNWWTWEEGGARP